MNMQLLFNNLWGVQSPLRETVQVLGPSWCIDSIAIYMLNQKILRIGFNYVIVYLLLR